MLKGVLFGFWKKASRSLLNTNERVIQLKRNDSWFRGRCKRMTVRLRAVERYATILEVNRAAITQPDTINISGDVHRRAEGDAL